MLLRYTSKMNAWLRKRFWWNWKSHQSKYQMCRHYRLVWMDWTTWCRGHRFRSWVRPRLRSQGCPSTGPWRYAQFQVQLEPHISNPLLDRPEVGTQKFETVGCDICQVTNNVRKNLTSFKYSVVVLSASIAIEGCGVSKKRSTCRESSKKQSHQTSYRAVVWADQ